MRVRQIHRAGAELDALGRVHERREKERAGGDVLGLVGGVFAAIGLGEAELVGEHEGFAVLAERLAPVLVERMDRHGEEAELHAAILPVCVVDCQALARISVVP